MNSIHDMGGMHGFGPIVAGRGRNLFFMLRGKAEFMQW